MRPQRTITRSAFSLVELLVVIAVIVVLIGILMPAVSRARESANRTVCMSNLRQVSYAFHFYSLTYDQQTPIGYRTASKQYNSMVYSTTAGGRWVLFGLLYAGGFFTNPHVLFCPSESNPKFMYATPENPWPPQGITPTANLQSGYCDRPQFQIPDDLAHPPITTPPFELPRIGDFGNRAIFADLTSSLTRVLTRHREGVNVLYGDGSVQWVHFNVFAQPANLWPDPTIPPNPSFNHTQDLIWAALDRG